MNRRALLCLVVLAVTTATATPSQGSMHVVKIDAAALATSPYYCEAPLETFTVAAGATLMVDGGTGAVVGSCTILLSEGSKLKFKDVTLTGSAILQITEGNKSQVSIKDSAITFDGDIYVEPGCCVAGGAKDKIKIADSQITSGDGVVRITAQLAGTGGKVDIKGSVLAGGGGAGDFIYVYASNDLGATKGSVKISSTTLDAVGASSLVSTNGGKTTVKKATLFFDPATPPTITAQGGKCQASKITPDTITCS